MEKFSAAHTSIQWSGDASGCADAAERRSRWDPATGCSALRESIDRAAARGRIPESHIELPAASEVPRLH